MKRQYYFYFLVDSDTGEPRYFGKTLNIEKRLGQHIGESKNCTTHKCNWIKSLKTPPDIKVIYKELCTIEESVQIEKTLMRKLMKRYKLTNSWDNCVGLWKTGKIVHQYDVSGAYLRTFENANHASIITKIADANILRSCKKMKFNKAGGFMWSFDKYTTYPDILKLRTVAKPIIQMDLNENFIKEFSSAREAEKILKISYKLISAVCTKTKKQTHGYKFKFKT